MKYFVYLFVAFSLFSCKGENAPINLAQLKWIHRKANESVILSSENKLLVGPGNIQVWGEYPYLYGDILQEGKYSCFMIDLRTETAEFDEMYKLKKKYSVPLHPEQFVTFQTLCGQHQCDSLKKILRKLLKHDSLSSSDSKNSRIPNADLFWKPVKGGNSMIVDDQGRSLIGPGLIKLWGQYPYLYGRIWMKPQSKFFVLNIETKKVEEAPFPYELFQKYHLPDNLVDLFRWEEIMGDWPGSGHARTLLKEAMAPNKLTPEEKQK